MRWSFTWPPPSPCSLPPPSPRPARKIENKYMISTTTLHSAMIHRSYLLLLLLDLVRLVGVLLGGLLGLRLFALLGLNPARWIPHTVNNTKKNTQH